MPKKIKQTENKPVESTIETPAQKQARVDAAGEAIRKVLDQYHACLIVTSLNIESGRVLPLIEVVAKDLPL